MSVSRWGRWVGAWLAVCVCAGLALADGHAWFVVPRIGGGARLVHLPGRDGLQPGGAAGTARVARDLDVGPDALAWWGDRVAMFFVRDGGLEVASLTAERVGQIGWRYLPETRLEPMPGPMFAGELLGATGEASGVAVLTRGEAGLAVTRFADGAWSEPEVLPEAASVAGEASLVTVAGRACVVTVEEAGATVWTRGEAAWQSSEPIAGVDASDRVFGTGLGSGPDAGLGTARWDDKTVRIGVIEGGERYPVASVDGVPQRYGLVRLDGGRVAIVHRSGPTSFRVVELSLATGRVLFDGEPRPPGGVSAAVFRALALALFVAMAGVLVVTVVVPNGSGTVTMPAGAALAEPGRRFFASMIDLLAASVLGAGLSGASWMGVLTATALFEPGSAWLGVPLTLLVGFAVGTVSEWVTGRSLGKLLAGCVVVREGAAPVTVTLGSSAVRNAVKWFLPPVAVLALFEQQGRHRGDVLAGALVVVPVRA